MENKISWESILSDFHSSSIDSEELETIITEAVEREYPEDSIEDFEYTDEGISVSMSSGQTIDIEIDWNEIILV